MLRKIFVTLILLLCPCLAVEAQAQKKDDPARVVGTFSCNTSDGVTEVVVVTYQGGWNVQTKYFNTNNQSFAGSAVGLQPAYNAGKLNYFNKYQVLPRKNWRDCFISLTPTETGVRLQWQIANGASGGRNLDRFGIPREVARMTGNWEGKFEGFTEAWYVMADPLPGNQIKWKIEGALLKDKKIVGKVSGTTPNYDNGAVTFTLKFNQKPEGTSWSDDTQLTFRHVSGDRIEYSFDQDAKTKKLLLHRLGAGDLDVDETVAEKDPKDKTPADKKPADKNPADKKPADKNPVTLPNVNPTPPVVNPTPPVVNPTPPNVNPTPPASNPNISKFAGLWKGNVEGLTEVWTVKDDNGTIAVSGVYLQDGRQVASFKGEDVRADKDTISFKLKYDNVPTGSNWINGGAVTLQQQGDQVNYTWRAGRFRATRNLAADKGTPGG